MKKITDVVRLLAVALIAAGAALNVLRGIRGYLREIAQDEAATPTAAEATEAGGQ